MREGRREQTSNCVKVTLIARKTQKEAPSASVPPSLFDNDSPEYQVLEWVDTEGNLQLEIARVQRDSTVFGLKFSNRLQLRVLAFSHVCVCGVTQPKRVYLWAVVVWGIMVERSILRFSHFQMSRGTHGIQPADIGWPTGNGKQQSCSQACCLAQLCLAAA